MGKRRDVCVCVCARGVAVIGVATLLWRRSLLRSPFFFLFYFGVLLPPPFLPLVVFIP
jgi:hypothetical protein